MRKSFCLLFNKKNQEYKCTDDISVNNQFVYKLIPWQIYSELHVYKVLS